jgi:hypothetical protein
MFGTAGAQSSATVLPPLQEPETCLTWYLFRQCLTSLSADLDGDKKPDRIGLIYSTETKTYQVVVRTAAGLTAAPFEASVDLGKAKVSLTVRSGLGDTRCRLWVERGRCGYPVMSHDLAENILYLSDSANGDYAIYLPMQAYTGFNKTGQFKVMRALEGPVFIPPQYQTRTPDPDGKR